MEARQALEGPQVPQPVRAPSAVCGLFASETTAGAQSTKSIEETNAELEDLERKQEVATAHPLRANK